MFEISSYAMTKLRRRDRTKKKKNKQTNKHRNFVQALLQARANPKSILTNNMRDKKAIFTGY